MAIKIYSTKPKSESGAIFQPFYQEYHMRLTGRHYITFDEFEGLRTKLQLKSEMRYGSKRGKLLTSLGFGKAKVKVNYDPLALQDLQRLEKHILSVR